MTTTVGTDMRSVAAFRSADGYFFDLDGCVYHSDRSAPGARELLELLARDGKRVGFITNNSRETGAEIAIKLRAMGISVEAEQIVAATEAVGAYVADKFGSALVKIAGSSSLARAVAQRGHTVLNFADATVADVVVVGRDTEFTFAMLQRIADEIAAGAMWVAANPDLWHPGPGGRKVAETGALVAAVQAVAGRPQAVVGKPGPYLFDSARLSLGLEASNCVMIGDNLLTDIAGGAAAGMTTVWIAGSAEAMMDGERLSALTHSPDLAVENMESLLSIYRHGATI